MGRDSEIAEIANLLARHRLVTLLGISGMGKTRLAIATAADVAHRFGDGVWFVDLVAATSDDEVLEAIASKLLPSVACWRRAVREHCDYGHLAAR